MVRFYHSTVHNASEADIVIIGVPDESRSHATRKGASKGPDILRQVQMNQSFLKEMAKLFLFVRCLVTLAINTYLTMEISREKTSTNLSLI